MDLFKTVGAIVLSVLGKKEFSTDSGGHLVLAAEESEKLNAQFKFAGGNFAELFKQSFDSEADASKGGNVAQSELVVKAFIETIRKEVIAEVSANKSSIEESLNQKVQSLIQEKSAVEQKVAALESAKADLEKANGILSAKTEDNSPEGAVGAIMGVKTPSVFKADRKLFHNKMAFDFLAGDTSAAIIAATNSSFSNKSMGGGAANSIDVSEINTEFGTYLSDQARRMTIYKELLRPTESREYMTKVLAITEWRDVSARIDSVVQQFISKWTPLGKVKFTPLKIVNRRHKINLPIVPDDITGGYLTYLYNESLTPDQMPVTKYIIDQLLRPRIADDIEYKMIATGKYEELGDVTEGSEGQAPEKSMDGFITILTEQHSILESKMNFWTPTVVFNEDNSVEYFEEYARWIKTKNPTLAKVGMNVFVDPDMDEIRRKKYREMFPLTKESDMNKVKIDFSNLTIVPLENMRGTGIMFSTPKQNFIELHHINEASGATNLFLQLQNYEVRVFGEFWLAVGFAVAEWVFAAVPVEASGN